MTDSVPVCVFLSRFAFTELGPFLMRLQLTADGSNEGPNESLRSCVRS